MGSAPTSNFTITRRVKNPLQFASLSKPETETIARWCAAEPGRVSLYTSDPRVARRMLREHPDIPAETYKDGHGHITGLQITLPSDCLRFRPGKRSVSPAQRESLARATAASRTRFQGLQPTRARSNPALQGENRPLMPSELAT